MAEKPTATQQALSKVEDQLSCPICLEDYTNPRLLSCFHVYCEHCLDRMIIRQGQLECPKCRQPTHLPPMGASGLQAAFHIHHLFDIKDTLKKIKEPQKLACEKCTKTTRKATSFCQQCTKFICDLCTTMHKEWEEFECHDMVSIENVEGDLIRLVSQKKMSLRCPKHDENMKLYCEPCRELICRDCTVHVHKDHKYCVIADTFESDKKDILDCLGPVKKQLEATNTALVNLDTRCGEIMELKTDVEADIHSKFDEIRRVLDDRETELMAQLEDHTQQQLKNLSAQREEVEILQTQRNSCVHFVTESVRTGSPGDVLKMKQGVVKQVKELAATFDPNTLEPREAANTCFIPSVNMIKLCKEFGSISCDYSIPPSSKKGSKSTAQFRFLSLINQLPNAELVSRLTQKTTKCSVVEQGRGQYKISYQPTVGGVHELHMRVGGQEVRENPFLVSVKTTLDKLGTDVRIIDGFKSPWGVAVNKSGHVIVAENGANVVSIFSPTGEKIRTLDTRDMAVGLMKNPCGVAVDKEDNILVVDSGNYRLLKFSHEGNLLAAVGSYGNGPGQYNDLYGVCVNSVNGKVYVVDCGATCVHILNSDLTFFSKFGRNGSGDGQFSYPCDVAYDCSGCVYVAEFGNRVQVFTPDGGYLRQFGKYGSGNGEFNGPASICVDSDDLVYVGDCNDRISVFTTEGEFLKLFGSQGSKPGQFNSPYGITVDQYGMAYVCDCNNSRVQMFY